jgi:hypothetical protein
MQRPLGVTITAILMASNVVADITLSLVAPSVVMPATHTAGTAFSPIMIAVHTGLAALIILEIVTVFYYWLGRFWARWLVFVGCVFYLTGLRTLPTEWHRSHAGATLTLSSAALAIFLIWYLHKREVRIWFAQPLTAAVTNK